MRTLVVALLAVLLTSILPTATIAQEVSDEVRVTNTTGAENYPSLAADSQGNYHMLSTVQDETVLHYRKLGPGGATLAGPTQLAPSSLTGTITGFSVAVDQSDRVHVTFAATATGATQNDIYYAQLNRDGTVTVTAKRIVTTDTNSANPDIGADSSGNAYIVYGEYNNTPNVNWLKVSASGSVSLGPKMVQMVDALGAAIGPARIAVAASGASTMFWLQKANGLVRATVWSARLDASGTVTDDPAQIFSSPIYDASWLQAAMGPDGNARATYVLNNQAHLLITNDQGNVDWEGSIAQVTIGEVRGTDVAVTSSRDSYIAFYSRANLLPTTEWRGYCVIRWDSNDTNSGMLSLEDGPGSVVLPSVAAGKGSVGIVYARGGDLWFVTIGAPAPSNNPPVARLSTRPAGPQVNQPVTFDGSTSSDPDAGDSVAGYSFAYGDGASSGWQTQSTITHTYTTAGTYIASLRVRDTHGTESSTAEVSVTVTGGTTTNKSPVAALTASPAKVGVGDDVLLDGTTSTDADGRVAQYLFSFGDGATLGWTSSSQTIHAYASAGVFTATLQVKDDKGKTSENTASVQVEVEAGNEPPTARIVSIVPSPALVGDAVTFTGEGTDPDGVIAQYLWESNYEPTLSEQSVFTTSTLEVGIHTISFKVRDDDGVWSDPATATLEVKRNNAPVVESRTNRTKGDTETVVEFLVRYTDVEGDYPTSAKLAYGRDGNYLYEDLREYDDTDKDVKDGKLYYFNTKLSKPGKWTYFFEFQNAKNAKVKSATGTVEIKEAQGFLPGPGAAMAALAMLAALGAATIAARGSRTAPSGDAGYALEPSKTVR